MKEYKDVFEGKGCMGGNYHIDIKPDMKPVCHPLRKVPVFLREPLKKDLKKLMD